ncbi:MAG: GNAT family N-acetyltransferase [Bacteroidota bacterium]|nr:GNAT family N-acetyltransferase [Bacteroidota bacterium]
MINGKNISLRALEPSDINLMYAWENDTDIWPVSGTLTPFSRHTMEQFVKVAHHDIYTNKQLRLAIQKKINGGIQGETIGFIDLFDFEPAHLRAGVGILIANKENRRKGFALESLNLLSNYSFRVLHLHQLYCHVHVNNEPSIRLFSSAGYKCNGELADWTLSNGSWVNVYIMQKVNSR